MSDQKDESDEDGVEVNRVSRKSSEGEEERRDEDAELGCWRPPGEGSSSRSQLRFQCGPYGVGSLWLKASVVAEGPRLGRRRTRDVKQTWLIQETLLPVEPDTKASFCSLNAILARPARRSQRSRRASARGAPPPFEVPRSPLDQSQRAGSVSTPHPSTMSAVQRTMGPLGRLLASTSANAVRPVALRSSAVAARAFSSSSLRSTAPAPTGKETPFTEPAGRNPAEDFKTITPALQEFGAFLMATLPKFVQQTSVYKDELTLYVPPTGVVPVMRFLRDHSNTQYKQVMDLCGVDIPTRSKRFEVVYHLLSVKHNSRIRVKTFADEVSPVPSITPMFAGADWYVSDPLGREKRGRRADLVLQVRARSLGHVWHLLHWPPRSPPYPHRLRVRGPPSPQGLPPHRASFSRLGWIGRRLGRRNGS